MAFGVAGKDKVAPGNMYPNHHIDEEMLLSYAAGALGHAASIVVASHLSLCPRCRAAVRTAEALGGVMLYDIEPAAVSSRSLAAVFARLDEPESTPAKAPVQPRRSLFGASLPLLVLDHLPADMDNLCWSWVQPGVKYTELLTDKGGARVGLMLIASATAVTPHGHSGDELTLVLGGGYSDGDAYFRRGDVQAVGEDVTHEPAADPHGGCLALVMVEGPVKPTRLIARIFRHFTSL